MLIQLQNAISDYIHLFVADYRFDIDELNHGNSSSGHYHSISWCWINVTQDESNKSWMERKCQATLWEGKGWEIGSYLG